MSNIHDIPGISLTEDGWQVEMTLRDHFAASLPGDDDSDDFGIEIKVALVGRTCPFWSVDALGCLAWIAEWRAKWRYMRADAMLAERDK